MPRIKSRETGTGRYDSRKRMGEFVMEKSTRIGGRSAKLFRGPPQHLLPSAFDQLPPDSRNYFSKKLSLLFVLQTGKQITYQSTQERPFAEGAFVGAGSTFSEDATMGSLETKIKCGWFARAKAPPRRQDGGHSARLLLVRSPKSRDGIFRNGNTLLSRDFITVYSFGVFSFLSLPNNFMIYVLEVFSIHWADSH